MNVIIFTDINNNYGFGRNLGAYTIASYLRSKGYTVQVVDFFSSITIDEMNKIINKFVSSDTKLVCFSNSFYQSVRPSYITSRAERLESYFEAEYFPQDDNYIYEMFKKIRDINPSIKFVMGGKKTKIFKKHPLIDHWVVSDGEESILQLINNSTNDKILRLPYVGFDKFKMTWAKNDYIFEDEALPLEISRGCPFRCAFCITRTRKMDENTKSAELLRRQLLDNYEKFGTKKYMIVDLTINENAKKARSIFNVFKSLPFKLEWTAVAKLDILYKNPWMIEEFAETGAKSVWFGIESFHKETVRRVNKTHVDPEILKEFTYELRDKWKNRVLFGSLFIVGLPHEPRSSIESTFNWLMDDDCPLHTAAFYGLAIKRLGNIDQNYSLIAEEMSKYGYEWNDDGWINTVLDMTESEAIEIATDYTNKIIQKRGLPPIYFYYSRLQNLWYTHDEILKINMDYKESFVESERRRELLKQIYIHKLLK